MEPWPENCSFFEHAEDAQIVPRLRPRWATKRRLRA